MPGRMCTTASVQGWQDSTEAGFQVQAHGKEDQGVEPVGGRAPETPAVCGYRNSLIAVFQEMIL